MVKKTDPAETPDAPETPPDPPVALYIGKKSGRYLANVEATDLTAGQVAASGYSLSELFASGLYKAPPVATPPAEAPAAPKDIAPPANPTTVTPAPHWYADDATSIYTLTPPTDAETGPDVSAPEPSDFTTSAPLDAPADSIQLAAVADDPTEETPA